MGLRWSRPLSIYLLPTLHSSQQQTLYPKLQMSAYHNNWPRYKDLPIQASTASTTSTHSLSAFSKSLNAPYTPFSLKAPTLCCRSIRRLNDTFLKRMLGVMEPGCRSGRPANANSSIMGHILIQPCMALTEGICKSLQGS